MSGGMSGLNGTGLLDRSAKQEEFLRQGGFAGIRMADNAKGPSAFNFVLIILIHRFFVILLTFP
jgi:hypothetical protein